MLDPGTDSDNEDFTASPSGQSDSEGEEVPFEQLLQLKQNGLGIYPHAPAKSGHRVKAGGGSSKPETHRRENKNRPMEVSSKRPVGRFREVLEGSAKRPIDPRFDDLTGKLDGNRFRKQYGFLFDEHLPAEKQQLKTAVQKTRDPERKKELQAEVQRLEQQIRLDRERKAAQKAAAEHKAKERAAVKAGKRPFFLKKSEQRRQELLDKYAQLRKSGHLDKYLEKRRKKNAAKDHRYVPGRRAGPE